MTITIPPFDYEKAVETLSGRWEELGLHWHCYTWRGTGAQYADDTARSLDSSDVAPIDVRAWLRKNQRLVRAAPKSPEEGLEWLQGFWNPIIEEAMHRGTEDWPFRYRSAVNSLSHGTDLTWSMWVRGPSLVIVGIIGTAERCH
ncbi:hypothetical protein [Actinomadura sp. WMMB 499]|uniref:hypothetical protein n=1 Tax=Actinomadura sp. WMMB 499 TaxID=1219491 RepID=UPI001243E585|nr:hypothetical protein [Actinomadura sp. WMMB 499]QFG25408.1 hypothetical protein F7P10_33890 [Actinomadura sp. WMMB 499]